MGSSGGGGSTSGMTDFPEYMKAFHGSMLNHNGASGLIVSVSDAFNFAAGGNSPYYNYITNGEPVAQAFMGEGKTINSYAKIFELLKEFQDLNFETVRASYNRNTTVEELTNAVSLALDDDIHTNHPPVLIVSLYLKRLVLSTYKHDIYSDIEVRGCTLFRRENAVK